MDRNGLADGDWFKFSKDTATKEHAIAAISAATGITPAEMIAFGDDYVDIGMLEL